MVVKNDHPRKKPIRIGKKLLQYGQVEDFDEKLLYSTRIQNMRDKGWLIFPCNN